MGKRGNENGQMRREEYEALESRTSKEPSGTFARASEEEIAKRRIIRRTTKTTSSPSTERGPQGSSGIASGGGGDIFGNVNFGVPAPVAAPSSSKPKFAMPTLPEYSTELPAPAKNPFGAISLTTSNPAPAQPTSSNSSPLESDKLLSEFKKFIANSAPRRNLELPVKRFVTTMLAQLEEENIQRNTTNASSLSPAFQTSTAPATSAPATSSLFPPASATKASLFGSSSAAPKPTFSFGASASSTSPAPAPFSGFSFNPATASAAPVPGTNIKVAFSPVPAPGTSGDADDDDAPLQDNEPSIVEGGADADWNLLLSLKIRVYHYRNEGGQMHRLAAGEGKVQQSKSNPKSSRLVLRDSAGKVLVNVGLPKRVPMTRIDPPGQKGFSQFIFMGILKEEIGVEKFAIVVKREDADKFDAKINQLTS